MTEINNNKIRFLQAAGFILLTAILAFLYRFITDFPIGDDPSAHIYLIAHNSFKELFSYNYPLPLSIFKFLQQLTHYQPQSLFIILICFFLFLATLMMYFLVKSITGSKIVAVISGLIFVSSYWTYDGLRMGLLAEVFGWFMFLVTLYFLVNRKTIWTIIFTLILALSHPYSFVIYCLIFAVYTVSVVGFSTKNERKFVVKLAIIYLAIAVAIYLIKPSLINKFTNFINPEKIGWGERNIFVFFTISDLRRVYVAFFALIGVISQIGNWSKNSIKILFSLLFIGMFMSFNQYYGIRFQVFRFFPYFEMGIAIFAALGIIEIVKIFKLKRNSYLIALISLLLIALIPQVYANIKTTYEQSHIASYDNSMTKGDREAIVWINNNVDHGQLLIAPRKRVLWILALTSHYNIVSDDTISNTGHESYKAIDSYVYYPEIYSLPDGLKYNLINVYSRDGVRIYQVNK